MRSASNALAPHADYIAVNVSSPNTPGLRGLQNREVLQRLLVTLIQARGGKSKPLLLKIAPDLDGQMMDDIAQVVLSSGIEGMIVSNTTIARPASLKVPTRAKPAGSPASLCSSPRPSCFKEMRKRVGNRVVLLGVGGVSRGADAYAKIRAGASLVQLYTALAYEGPGVVPRIKRELLECLVRDGFAHLTDAIGADFK